MSQFRDPQNTNVFIYGIEVFGSGWSGQIHLENFNQFHLPQGRSIYDYLLAW
ncbi:hypothetical protein [Microvirga roseola]|uniref:hypothetical protein n=1 Tax=Microvirga roseola TaxID=2883126 RepID=UPI001E4CA8C3|nr:hypothetical protein [Microvirga roseola]